MNGERKQFANPTSFAAALVIPALIAGGMILTLASREVAEKAGSAAAGAPAYASQRATQGQRPIPAAGPLARPKSPKQIGLPVELTRISIPSDNLQTPEKVALGEKLFFDGRLSADGTVACSTCHDPAHAFTDGLPLSVGIKGRVGQRNAPTILNALYNKTQFWDGRAKTLEEQAALPIVNPTEMGQPSLDVAVERIAAIKEYELVFRSVFDRAPNGTDLLRAIASYERTQLSFDSPFDHFIAGDKSAIDDAAKRGWEIFNIRGRCTGSSGTTSWRWPDRPSNLLIQGTPSPSIRQPFRQRCRPSAGFSSPRKRPISLPLRRPTCATCS